MIRNLRVIDLFPGLGGRSAGFQRAGYDVVCAVDDSAAYREIYNQIVENSEFVLVDIEQMEIADLPETDIITAKIFMDIVSSAMDGKTQNSKTAAVYKMILEKMPRAFVLEIPGRMIYSQSSAALKSNLAMEMQRRYNIAYQIMDESEFSGFPVSGKQVYMVGIRVDLLYDDAFCFPQGEQLKKPIFQENEKEVDIWYRKILFDVDIKLQEGKYYTRERKKFYQTDSIRMGAYKEMFLADSLGLRKMTHNECAFLKGLKGYDFDKYSNKYKMYAQIAQSSNVFVVCSIAAALRECMEYKHSNTSADYEKQNYKKEENKKKKEMANKTPGDIRYPKQKLTALHIDNLKGIKNLDISFDKNLTAIMGVNGVGKSTILHALACIYKPYKLKEDYKFSFFFTPNPDSSWKNSRFSITYWDENYQKNFTREYKKNTDRWSPRYTDRPQRDTCFIGIETCVPEIEKERQMSYIDYKTSQANERNSDKIVRKAAYILNKDYDQLNYHKTKKKELLGVHTTGNMKYSSLSMGAGEQRVLRILKTIYTAVPYSLILIDEIDILLHVTALKRMIQVLSEVAVQRNLQIIFTTHSMEMNHLQHLVDIRYLSHLEEKTMVYDKITPDIVYELSENVEQSIKIYVEDTLAETIVNVVAEDLGIARNVKVIKLGAASNAFVLAASLILQGGDHCNDFILLDGDVYRSNDAKRDAVKKVLSGTEENHDTKVDQALGLIYQLTLPEGTEPEKFIFDMLVELEKSSELIDIAKNIKAVSDSHQWLDNLAKRMGRNKELILNQIVGLVSEHEKWENYVSELREYLLSHRDIESIVI